MLRFEAQFTTYKLKYFGICVIQFVKFLIFLKTIHEINAGEKYRVRYSRVGVPA